MDARSEILRRIAASQTPSPPAPRGAKPVATQIRPNERLDRFVEYASDYKARVQVVAAAELAKALHAALAGEQRVVVASDFPSAFLPASKEIVAAQGLAPADLVRMDAVLTLCALGIAETGTIVLDAGPGQGRRAITLVPDHHVCIILEEQIVGSVPEAVEWLGESVRAGHPLTFISGPSATSDIELVRVEGVHGPRRLDIVVVRNAFMAGGEG